MMTETYLRKLDLFEELKRKESAIGEMEHRCDQIRRELKEMIDEDNG